MSKVLLRKSDSALAFDFVAFKSWLLCEQSLSYGSASDVCTYLRKALGVLGISKPTAKAFDDFRKWGEVNKIATWSGKGVRSLYLANQFRISRSKLK